MAWVVFILGLLLLFGGGLLVIIVAVISRLHFTPALASTFLVPISGIVLLFVGMGMK